MSVIALPDSVMSKFTAVSIMWSEFVVLYGEFLGNYCLSTECTTDGTTWDGRGNKQPFLLNLWLILKIPIMFDLLSPNVFIITLYKQVIEGYCMDCAHCGQVSVTLWLHRYRANEIAVRDHNPIQGCGLFMNRTFLKLHTVKKKAK